MLQDYLGGVAEPDAGGMSDETLFRLLAMMTSMEALGTVGENNLGWNTASVEAMTKTLDRQYRKMTASDNDLPAFMRQAAAAVGEFIQIHIGGEWIKTDDRWLVRLSEAAKHDALTLEKPFPDGYVFDPAAAVFEWIAGVTANPFAPIEALIGPPPTKSAAKSPKFQAMTRPASKNKKSKR